jgi:hypothetical protein
MIALIKRLKPQKSKRETENGKQAMKNLENIRLKEGKEKLTWGGAICAH